MNSTKFVRMPTSKQMLMMGIPELPEAAFGGDLPPMQRRALVQAMGIRPQGGGGGGGLLAVVAVVAAVAIPFAAPAIAASIGMSGAIAGAAASAGLTAATAATVGSVVGSAIVGAGLGAVSAAVTGGNVGRGALMGGLGGGVSGYFSAPDLSAASSVPNQAINAANASADPLEALNASQGWTTAGATPANIAVTNNGAVATMGPTGWEVNGVSVPSNTIAYGGQVDSALASQLSTAQDASAAANAIQSSGTLSVNTPQAIGGNAGYLGTTNYIDPNAGATAANAAQGGASYAQAGLQVTPAAEAAARASGAFAPTASTATYAPVSNAANGGTAATNAANAAKAPVTLSEALKAKFTDPKNQADMILRAAGQLAGSAIAGDGLSPEEKQLLEQQKAELAELKKTNQELFNQRVQGAQDLIGESRYFDPSYFGLQSARNVMNQGARAKQQALRDIGPNRAGLRASEARRFDLGIGTGSQTAYMQGADNAEQNKIRLQTAGLSALPTSAPSGALQYGNYLGSLYDAADKRRRQTASDVGSLFGSFTGASSSRSTG
jgi:hypothetical protein